MTVLHDHEHEFVPVLIPLSELRERCKHCTCVRLIPNPGDSDTELTTSIMLGAKSNMPQEQWISLVARMMQRQYERETGMPAFAASLEYAIWLKRPKTP